MLTFPVSAVLIFHCANKHRSQFLVLFYWFFLSSWKVLWVLHTVFSFSLSTQYRLLILYKVLSLIIVLKESEISSRLKKFSATFAVWECTSVLLNSLFCLSKLTSPLHHFYQFKIFMSIWWLSLIWHISCAVFFFFFFLFHLHFHHSNQESFPP